MDKQNLLNELKTLSLELNSQEHSRQLTEQKLSEITSLLQKKEIAQILESLELGADILEKIEKINNK